MEQINKKFLELSKKMPRGSKKIIAQRTELTEKTVCNFFLGRRMKLENSLKIIAEAKKILKEQKILLEELSNI